MNGSKVERGTGGALTSESVVKVLLVCGIISSLLYIAADVLASSLWQGYSYVNQAVSELNAIGAPTRPLILVLFSAYNVLVVAFAVGVWASAGKKRSLRVAAVMLAIYAVVGELTIMFSPMNLRGTAIAPNDIGHITLTAIEVLSMVLFIAFGSGARGKAFRFYSIASIVVIIGAGATVGALSTHMTAAASSTPWAGLLERANIYSLMLWIVVFALVLMKTNRERAFLGGGEAGAAPAPKKVTAFVGSPHRGGATFTAVRRFLDHLEAYGDVQSELVMLGDYDIGTCRGCKVCFERGEEFCPLKDDRDVLLGKMMAADAIVLASPNYSWGVSGVMKVFLDRLGFAFHRPRFHGKTATAIVVQGIFRGAEIRKYLEFVEGGLGFTVVRGSVSRTLEPMTAKAWQSMDTSLAEQSRRFHDQLLRPAYRVPSLFELMMFRMGRMGIKLALPEDKRDYQYYRDHGWFESDYYYPTRLGPIKKVAGAFFDWLGPHTSIFKVADEPAPAPWASSKPVAQ